MFSLARPARIRALAAVLVLGLAVAGCGGGEPDSTGARAGDTTTSERPAGDGGGATTTTGEGERGTLVAALGDSITAGSPGYDPDPEVRAALGDADRRSQFEYWAERADPRLELRNCGVSGERTDEIEIRLADCAEGADALIVQGGTNDIAAGRPVPEIARNLRSMVRSGERLGLDVYVLELPPWNNGPPRADAQIAELNASIERIGRDEGAVVIRAHDALEDPAAPGTMPARLTADGIHPSVSGYRRLGKLVAERIGG